jgi:hypothetical protein
MKKIPIKAGRFGYLVLKKGILTEGNIKAVPGFLLD